MNNMTYCRANRCHYSPCQTLWMNAVCDRASYRPASFVTLRTGDYFPAVAEMVMTTCSTGALLEDTTANTKLQQVHQLASSQTWFHLHGEGINQTDLVCLSERNQASGNEISFTVFNKCVTFLFTNGSIFRYEYKLLHHIN